MPAQVHAVARVLHVVQAVGAHLPHVEAWHRRSGSPSRLVTVPRSTSGSPSSSMTIESPNSLGGAPSTWKGPNTVGSVVPSAAAWLTISTSIDTPRVSDRRMNSWRTSSHLCPTAVRNWMPANHSSRVRPTSSTKACRCLTAARMISTRPGVAAANVAWTSARWSLGVMFSLTMRAPSPVSLDDDGDPLADADAHRRQPVAAAGAAQVVDQGGQDAGARAARAGGRWRWRRPAG